MKVPNLEWQESNATHDEAWDQFVDESPNGHHEQSSAWGRLKAAYGWKPIRLAGKSSHQIVAGGQFLERKLGPFGRVGYLSQGPILDFQQASLLEEAVREIDQFARLRYSYLVIDPPYFGAGLQPVLAAAGFKIHDKRLPPANSFDTTTVIDLTKDLDSIFEAFNSTKRKHLRRSFKTDLKFRLGGKEDVATFQKLMWNLCDSRHSKPNPPQPDFFARAWREFPNGKIVLFILENATEILGAMWAFQCGDWIRCWKIGSARKDEEKFPSERIWWESIKISKEMGFRWFDFVYVDRDTVRHLREGVQFPAPWEPDNITVFKLRFGADILFLPPQLIKIYNPALRLLKAAGADQLLQSKLPRKILAAIRARRGR